MAHIAAADPGEAGRYVAAALIGGNQLLVVSVRYAQPALLNERLYRGDHEGAYVELNAASVRDGKLFVQDLGEPGHALDALLRSLADVAAAKGTGANP